MNKSIIIILSAVWVLSTMYLTLAETNPYPYRGLAITCCWVSSILVFISIILFIRKNRNN